MGLVQLVLASLTTRSIQRLTQTYLTLSLADIASRVGLASPEQAEMRLIRMVQVCVCVFVYVLPFVPVHVCV